MAAIKSRVDCGNGDEANRFTETFVATGALGPFEFRRSNDGVLAQISGTATSVTFTIERCTNDPNGAAANWVPADSIFPLTVNLATSPIPPMVFNEPTRASWRLRITAITGGNAIAVMEGEA